MAPASTRRAARERDHALLDWPSHVEGSPMSSSIFWYDYETTGINPRCDRPLQVAGLRTDEQLNEIGEPLNLYCQPSDDILPHPAACRITGITPQILAEKGLTEAEFMARVHAQWRSPAPAAPATTACVSMTR